MRLIWALSLSLLLMPCPNMWAENSQASSQTPNTAATPSHGADVLWYGKAPPGLYGGVGNMQSVAPRTGWAERGGRYYWTSDNGTNWRDITPPSSLISESQVTSEGESYENLNDVFFADGHRGWALFSLYDDPANPKEQPKFELAFTSDAGATWTKRQLAVPPAKDWQGSELFGGDPELDKWAGQVVFADAEHGLITINAGSMHTYLSLMLTTSDGGKTWKQLRHAPAMVNAHALMVTPSDVWLFGGAYSLSGDGSAQGLYVTRDGGESWQLVYNMEVGFATPKGIARTDLGPATCYVMGVPKFENSKHGFLEVTCSTPQDVQVHYTKVLFATNDSGRTWKPDRVVANLNDYQSNLYGCSAVAGSEWIFAASPGPDLPTFTHRHNVRVTDDVVVTKIDAGARIDARLDAADLRAALPVGITDSRLDLRFYGDATECSFVTPSDGWVIVGEGYLKSTKDGGATWTDIVPGPKPHVIQPHQ